MKIIIAIIATSILLVVGGIIWLIVWLISLTKWPPEEIKALHKIYKQFAWWTDKQRNCVVDYITSTSFLEWRSITPEEQGVITSRAITHCGVSLTPPPPTNN